MTATFRRWIEKIKHSSILMRQTVAQAAILLTILSLSSKPVGMLREFVTARYFGATAAKDAFIIANNVPAIFGLLIGAFMGAFLPAFVRLREQRGETEAWRFASKVFTFLFLLVVLSSVAMFLLAGPSVSLLAGGLDPERHDLATLLTQYLVPILFMNAFLGFFSSILNSYRHFLLQSVAAFLANFILLGTVILFAPRWGIPALIAGSIGQILFQLLVVGGGLWRRKPYLRLDFHWRDPSLYRIIRLAIPLAIGGFIGLINLLVDRTIGSYLPIGSISTLDYAQRILTIPLMLIGNLTAALYPSLAISWAQREGQQFRLSLGRGLSSIWFIIIPSTAGLIFLGKPLISILLQTGAFTAEDTSLTAAILLYYALGLFAAAGSGILSNTFVILGDTLTPMIAGTIAIGINIGLNILFALAWGMGAPGLALATTISGTLNFCALLLLLQKKVSAGIFGGLWLPVGKTLLASGIMGTACYFLWWALEGIWHPTQYGPRLGLVLLVVLIGISLYTLLSWLLRIPEFDRYRGYLLRGIGKLRQITGRTKT